MKKRLVALGTAALLLFSSHSVFAASFTDLNEFHAWAEPQIEDMTTLGIIKGYTDGSFRPDQSITKTEALVLISRAAGYITENYEDYKAVSTERYASVVEGYDTLYPKEVSYLLYKGILKENELNAYISSDRANSPLLRYEMAELLTKLMRADSAIDLNEAVTLNYSDAGEIPHSAKPFVNYVTNAALMQGVYDPEYPDDIFFKPYSSVTRAQMAVLLHRVLSKMNISVSHYSVVGRNASSNSITYRDDEGKTIVYKLANGVNLIVDGYATRNVSNIATGAKMAFFKIDNTLADIEVINPTENKWNGVEKEIDTTFIPTESVEGVISTLTFSSDDCSLIIDDVEYTLAGSAVIYVNNIASSVYDLRVGYTAGLDFEDGKVVFIYATNSLNNDDELLTASGTITKVNVTNRSLYLNVTNSETGMVSEKQLFIETGASILNPISGKNVDFLELEIDDHIIATGTLKDGKFYASKIIVR